MIITGSTLIMETVSNDMETEPNEFSIKIHQNVFLTNPVFLRIVVLKNVTCCGEGYTFKLGDFLVPVFFQFYLLSSHIKKTYAVVMAIPSNLVIF
jgi:hypothetical protein